MGDNLSGMGFHAWKPGILLWIQVDTKELWDIIYEPTYEDVLQLCTKHDLDFDQTWNVILNRKPDVQGFLFEAEKWRESCKKNEEKIDFATAHMDALNKVCQENLGGLSIMPTQDATKHMLSNQPMYMCCEHCKPKYCPEGKGHYVVCPNKLCIQGKIEEFRRL